MVREHQTGVAQVLAEVEQKWLQLSFAKAQCGLTLDDPFDRTNYSACVTNVTDEFSKSCSTVSTSVMNKVGGDKSRMTSYMEGGVCRSDLLQGELKKICVDYSQVFAREMKEQAENGFMLDGATGMNVSGTGMNLTKVCVDLFRNGYLSQIATTQAKKLRADRAAKAAKEQIKGTEEQIKAAAAARVKKEAEEKAALAGKPFWEMVNATVVAIKKHNETQVAAAEAQRQGEELHREKLKFVKAVAKAVETQRKADQVGQAENVKKRRQRMATKASEEAQALKQNLQKMTSRFENATLEHKKAAKAYEEARVAKEYLENISATVMNRTQVAGTKVTSDVRKTTSTKTNANANGTKMTSDVRKTTSTKTNANANGDMRAFAGMTASLNKTTRTNTTPNANVSVRASTNMSDGNKTTQSANASVSASVLANASVSANEINNVNKVTGKGDASVSSNTTDIVKNSRKSINASVNANMTGNVNKTANPAKPFLATSLR